MKKQFNQLSNMTNFPKPESITRKYIDHVPHEELEDLLEYLNNRFNEALSPTSSKDRLSVLHIESLIRITRANIAAIAILDEVGKRR